MIKPSEMIFKNSIFSVVILLIQSNITYELIIHKKHAVRKKYSDYDNTTWIRHKRSSEYESDHLEPEFGPHIKLKDIESEITQCFDEPKMWCNDKSKYRSIDGSCNNLNKRSWGMKNTATFRVATARYDDDTCSVHTLSGEPLPSALKISDTITNLNRLLMVKNVTTFFSIFAQVIADDVVSSIIDSKRNFCCSNNLNTTFDRPSCNCMETSIPQRVPNCNKFARSKTTLDVQCPIFPVYQLSSTTSFIDASFLYPTDGNELASLRTNKTGKLKISTDNKGRPFIKTYQNFINVTYDTERSFVHTNTGTKVLQTMFIRMHNFLCEVLSWMNPSWDDTMLFRESRRLLIAMYQQIVYFEFIPIIIGYDYAMKYDLMPKKNKIQNTYDSDINPKTVNSFATAAFRYFHVLLPSSISLADYNYKIIKNVSFIGTVEDIDITQYDWYDSIIRGSTTNSLMDQDQLDSQKRRLLHAVDIERGRDHGLKSYNDYREACGLHRINDFEHLVTLMDRQDVIKLAGIYKDIDEIELYVGGILEKPIDDAIVGPTFQCLIGEAFYRYKYGDRFFYEHKNVMGQFTREQLLEIKKVTASLIICTSSDAMLKVQTNAFYLPSIANPYVPCELIPRPDYTLWQAKPDEKPKLISNKKQKRQI